MLKVFISLVSNNKTKVEIEKEIIKAIEDIKNQAKIEEEIIVLQREPANPPEESNDLWNLGFGLQALSRADIAYFCKDWYKDRACKIEHKCTGEYRIETIYA